MKSTKGAKFGVSPAPSRASCASCLNRAVVEGPAGAGQDGRSRGSWSILEGGRRLHGLGQALLQARQPRRLILDDQGVDDFVERFAVHHLGQVVEGQVDAVV